MSYFSEDRMAEMRQFFFETAQELLQALNEEALQLERTPTDAEIVSSIRRTVHTLKGDSAACGFRELSEIAHTLEDALAPEIASAAPALSPAIAICGAATPSFCKKRHAVSASSYAAGNGCSGASRYAMARVRVPAARPASVTIRRWLTIEPEQ